MKHLSDWMRLVRRGDRSYGQRQTTEEVLWKSKKVPWEEKVGVTKSLLSLEQCCLFNFLLWKNLVIHKSREEYVRHPPTPCIFHSVSLSSNILPIVFHLFPQLHFSFWNILK